MFKEGDQVIKKTGGNKMSVVEIKNDLITCIWATESVHLGSFTHKELMKIEDYESLMSKYDRDDKIKRIITD